MCRLELRAVDVLPATPGLHDEAGARGARGGHPVHEQRGYAEPLCGAALAMVGGGALTPVSRDRRITKYPFAGVRGPSALSPPRPIMGNRAAVVSGLGAPEAAPSSLLHKTRPGAPGRIRTCVKRIRSPLPKSARPPGLRHDAAAAQPDIASLTAVHRGVGPLRCCAVRSGPPRERVPHLCPSVGVAQLVRAPGCGPGGRGFETPRSPRNMPEPRQSGPTADRPWRDPGEVRG